MIDRRGVVMALAGGVAFPATAVAQTSAPGPSPAPPASGYDIGVLTSLTQALLESVMRGDSSLASRLFADEAAITDEAGAVIDKKALLDSIQPFGPRISAVITARELKVQTWGDLAVVTYAIDEAGRRYDQPLHCQYRTTDSWRRTDQGWRIVARQLLAVRTDPPSVPYDARALKALPGTYALASDRVMTIAADQGALTLAEDGGPARALLKEADGVFFVPGRPRCRYLPVWPDGRHVAAIIERREAWDLKWARRA